MSPKIITEEDLNYRETEIIDTAIHILAKEGWKAFTMDRVVDRVPFSKGSVYKLFCSKEDLFVAITNDGLKKGLDLCHRAYSYKGNWREKYLAMSFSYVLYARLFPVHFYCEQTAVTPVILEKASPSRIKQHKSLRALLWDISLVPVEKALAEGQISLLAGYRPDDVLSATFYAECGCLWIILSGDVEIVEDQVNLEEEYFKTINILLDGFHWKPLISEWDYYKSLRCIAKDIFPEEVDILKNQDLDYYIQLAK